MEGEKETRISEGKKKKKAPKEDEKNAYDLFLENNRKEWLWFNFIGIILSILCAIGTALVVSYESGTCLVGNLKIALWLVFAMHIVNTIEAFINLFGCEKKICTGMMMCGFFVFEITILVYMQVIYF